MSTSLLFAHPRVIAWRNRLRQNNLLRTVYGSIASRGDYEARFSRDLLNAVRPEDTVWDIGANIGVYASQFADRGATVVCFEPAPEAIAALRRRFEGAPASGARVQVVPIALSNARSTALFSADGSSPNNQIITTSSAQPTVEIQVHTGDAALAEFSLPSPNVMKIDVEGYELEVIQGMSRLLSSKTLRSVFVEVHFALLHARGLDHAPATILRLLREHGFQVRWVDPSHIGAHRN